MAAKAAATKAHNDKFKKEHEAEAAKADEQPADVDTKAQEPEDRKSVV